MSFLYVERIRGRLALILAVLTFSIAFSTSAGAEVIANPDNYTAQARLAGQATPPPLMVSAPGVLANDTSTGNRPLTASGPNFGPSNGTLSLGADGGFTYTPNTNFVGADSFVYTVSDGQYSASATVSINVSSNTAIIGNDPSGVNVCPGPGLTRRIMPCIKNTIIFAVNNFLTPLSMYLSSAIGAACILAIAIWGAMMVNGRVSASLRETAVLGLKVGAVITFSYSFGGLFPAMLTCMDWLVSSVMSYASSSLLLSSCITDASYGGIYSALILNDSVTFPSYLIWDYVDCAIQLLIGGIYTPFSLMSGLVGFLFSSLFSGAAGSASGASASGSGAAGFFVAIMGFYLLCQFLAAVARSLFIYLMSYTAFSLMALISPLFIPLILFRATIQYFTKWLRLTMSFFVQPMIIFVYLALLLAAFDAIIFTGSGSLFRALVSDNNFTGVTVNTPGFEIGSWLYNSGSYQEREDTVVDPTPINIDPNAAMKQLGMGAANAGIAGRIADATNVKAQDWQRNLTNPMGILGKMGIGADPVTGVPNNQYMNFAPIEMPTQSISWPWLASMNNYLDGSGNADTTTFLVNLFLILFMGVVISYIFLVLLDAMPYISAAVAGKPIGGGSFIGRKMFGDFLG
ncbi:MAG: cadherin-like domain-containing protein [Pseudomonadota bacterium]|nr:cadherin-like domain-containing protein [Pseudomonadota bacterium]